VKSKPIIPRVMANRDVDEAIRYYLEREANRRHWGLSTPWNRLMPIFADTLPPDPRAMRMR